MKKSVVYVGLKGQVLALDRATGTALWATALKGRDFVTVLVDGDHVFAGTKGELFCLDRATGQVLWSNNLPGLGWGFMSIATATGTASPAAQAMKRRHDESAAAGG